MVVAKLHIVLLRNGKTRVAMSGGLGRVVVNETSQSLVVLTIGPMVAGEVYAHFGSLALSAVLLEGPHESAMNESATDMSEASQASLLGRSGLLHVLVEASIL